MIELTPEQVAKKLSNERREFKDRAQERKKDELERRANTKRKIEDFKEAGELGISTADLRQETGRSYKYGCEIK